MPTMSKKKGPATSTTASATQQGAAIEAAPSSYRPRVVNLTDRQVRQLTEQGLRMRREIEARYASMKVITEDDLKIRAR